jgi:hypothetical protein
MQAVAVMKFLIPLIIVFLFALMVGSGYEFQGLGYYV